MNRIVHHLFALLGRLVGIVGRPRRIGGMTRDFLGRGRHFVHRRRHLIRTAELFAGAVGHQGGNGIELATGAVQIRGAALQAAEGFGQKIAQGIGRHRQPAQLVLTIAGHALGEASLAQFGNVADQPANRLHQLTVDQPRAQQANQQPREQHHHNTRQHGAIGAGTDQPRLLVTLLAQRIDQLAHLLAGRAVHAFDCVVTHCRIAPGGQVCVTPLLIGHAQHPMLFTQAFDSGLERRVDCRLTGQLAEDVLHIALTVLELLPVLVQVGRLLAAQQDVFPLLYLRLELQVGLIDQLRGVQRAFDQVAIILHPIGEEVKAGQRDQQHRKQAATQQCKDLSSQGLVQKHRGISHDRNKAGTGVRKPA
ncbi:hypothetical protein D3C84_464090 [compost metagenome]